MTRYLATIAAVALACGPAVAQPVTAEQAVAGCEAAMGWTDEECLCMLENVYVELNERQVEYFLARAAHDAAATARLNRSVGIFQRLDLYLTIRDAARTCAPSRPFSLPGVTDGELRAAGL